MLYKLVSSCRCLDIYIQACTKASSCCGMPYHQAKKLLVEFYNDISNDYMYKLL